MIGLDRSGPVASITLPEGPWGRPDLLSLEAHLDELHEDEGLRVLLLLSGGEDFCPGGAAGQDLVSGLDPVARLASLRVPVLAAVSGRCQSPGASLLLGADLRIGHVRSTFRFPDLEAGAFPPWGAVQRLTRLVGPGRAAWLLLTGAELDALGALRDGLVQEIDDRPAERVGQLSELLLSRAPLALEYTKEAVQRGRELPLHHALRLEADFNHLLQASTDRAEGLQAFFDKRPARFEGR